MSQIAERERLVCTLVRLRRAERSCPSEDDLAAVRSELERMIGRSVTRALAARLLGVSQTALDRRIANGDLPAVIAPGGRREVPLHALVDLIEAVQDPERPNDEARPLSAIVREHRANAERLDPEAILPRRLRRAGDGHGHRPAELRSLAYHRAVAQRLDERLVDDARRRLRQWRIEERIDPGYADAWEELLARPLPKIVRAIGEDSERARALRQCSPFAGALSEPERRRVLEAVR